MVRTPREVAHGGDPRYRYRRAWRRCRSDVGRSSISTDHVNAHVAQRKVTMVLDRTTSSAWEAAHEVTGHVRGKSRESEATDSVGSESGSMVAPGCCYCPEKKDGTINGTSAEEVQ